MGVESAHPTPAAAATAEQAQDLIDVIPKPPHYLTPGLYSSCCYGIVFIGVYSLRD
jgi:hypothetical protein